MTRDKNSEIRIEELGETGLTGLSPLLDAFVAAHLELRFRADYQRCFWDWMRRLRHAPDSEVYVAKAGGEPVGMIIATVDGNGPLLTPEKIGYVPMLAVLPDSRRHGIGTAL